MKFKNSKSLKFWGVSIKVDSKILVQDSSNFLKYSVQVINHMPFSTEVYHSIQYA